ncbi:MAG: universal stress protein [Gammaproteobacteria bacterium]|nr:universal stress protein [Gammaproteobacteria bacterium]
MRRFQNIVYVSDGVHDEIDGLKQALSLARNNNAHLKVLVIYPELPSTLTAYRANLEQALSQQVQASIQSAQTALLAGATPARVTVVMISNSTPATLAIQHVLRDGHDLLIKAASRHEPDTGFEASDMDLLRKCPCPVWLCRPIACSRNEIHVAVAIDADSTEPAAQDLALQLLQVSRSLADSWSGKLSIISCWDFPYEDYLTNHPFINIPQEDVQRSVTTAEQEHRAALSALLQHSGIGGLWQEHNVRGAPEKRIPECLHASQVDILVMGTVARTGIPGFIMGNTAENVVQHIDCSLLAMKPAGFVSPVKAY